MNDTIKIFFRISIAALLVISAAVLMLDATRRPQSDIPPEKNTTPTLNTDVDASLPEGARIEQIPIAPSSVLHSAQFGDYALTVPDHPPGTTFAVPSVRFPINGWVAVYEILGGSVDRTAPLGALFFPGVLSLVQSGGGTLQKPLVAGREYVAIMQGDNGDLSFKAKDDPIMKNTSGTQFMVRFRVENGAVLP